MTYVVTENCQRCRFTDCVQVCPVDCFHGDDAMLYIDPAACIDCGACVHQCPVNAIYEDRQLPDSKKEWVQINADRAAGLPEVKTKQPALSTADARKKELGF